MPRGNMGRLRGRSFRKFRTVWSGELVGGRFDYAEENKPIWANRPEQAHTLAKIENYVPDFARGFSGIRGWGGDASAQEGTDTNHPGGS